jgi:hypothetical protein
LKDNPACLARALAYLVEWEESKTTKGGVVDLMKARHYLDKLIEVEEAKQ